MKCYGCCTTLAEGGPTRCDRCAGIHRERARIANANRDDASRERARVRYHDTKNPAARRSKYKSKAREQRCLDCPATMPTRRGPKRCPPCLDAYQRHYYAAKNAAYVRDNAHANRRRRAKQRATRRDAVGSFSMAEWTALKLAYGQRCLCCQLVEPEIKLEPDHVVPLARGGTDMIENIQPLCRSCNASKRAKTIDYREFTPRHPNRAGSSACLEPFDDAPPLREPP